MLLIEFIYNAPVFFFFLHEALLQTLTPPYSRDDGDVHKSNRKPTSSVLARLKQRAAGEREKKTEDEEKKEAELHLYAVMHMSQIYVHLQRSWNSYIMVRDLCHGLRKGLSQSG